MEENHGRQRYSEFAEKVSLKEEEINVLRSQIGVLLQEKARLYMLEKINGTSSNQVSNIDNQINLLKGQITN